MNPQVVLVVPPFNEAYPGSQSPIGYRLGVGYLAAMLRQHGLTTETIHCPVQGLSADACAEQIAGWAPGLVGISTLFSDTDVPGALALAGAIKSRTPGVHVSLGGHPVSFAAEDILQDFPAVDTVARGEGEYTLLELAQRIVAGQPWGDTPGLAARQNGRLAVNPTRPLVEDLDTLPWPDRETLGLLPAAQRGFSVLSSRGCPYRCSYCCIHEFYRLSPGRAWRGRRPEKVADEVEHLKRHWQAEIVEFSDDNFIGPGRMGKERAYGIAKELIRRKLNVQLAIECRADSVEPDLFAFLKCAGLFDICLGIESGVQQILDFYRKDSTVAVNRRALEILNRLGFRVRIGFIGFNPIVTLADVKENVRFFKETGLAQNPLAISSFFGHLQVFRGTHIERQLDAHGVLTPKPDQFWLKREYRYLDPSVHALAQVAYMASERPGRRRLMGDVFIGLQQTIQGVIERVTGLHGEALARLLSVNGLFSPEAIACWREQSVLQMFQTFARMVEALEEPREAHDGQALAEHLRAEMQATMEAQDAHFLGMPFDQAVQKMKALEASQCLAFVHEGRRYEIDLVNLKLLSVSPQEAACLT